MTVAKRGKTRAQQKSLDETRIAERRERVSYWRKHGLSTRAIAAKIATEGFTNDDGNTLSHTTIMSDLEAVKQAAIQHASADLLEHRARQLDELALIKYDAITRKDAYAAMRALELEAKLLGTPAPATLNININMRIVTELVQVLQDSGANVEEFFNRAIQRVKSKQAMQVQDSETP